MDYQRFIEQLPGLYENWGQPSVHPKSDIFRAVLEQVQGMTTANVMQLLNLAVDCMELDEVYCEIGCFQGATLSGALLNHPLQMAYAVDNFSEFDAESENIEQLSKNLSLFDLDKQVIFCHQDFEEFFWELREISPAPKIGVYLYDGAHDYRSQLLGLMLVKPFLADRALIIVDDSNWKIVQQANWDFISAHPQCQLLLDLPTPSNFHGTFWNGLQILSWDVNQKTSYDWSSFVEKFRHESVIKELYDFCIELERQPQEEVIDYLTKEALSLQANYKFLEAEQKYQEILQWDSKNANAYQNLGMVYYGMSRFQDGLTMLLKGLEFDDSKALYHYSLGLVLEKVGGINQAVEAYKKAITQNPQYIDAYNNLGNILYTAGEIEQAELVYRQAIAVNPQHFGSYLNLGNVLLVKCQIDEAIAVYEAALKLQHNPDISTNLEFALKLKTDKSQALLFSGNYFYEHQRYQEAIEQYQNFLTFQTGNESLYFILGECYEHLRQYQEAIEVYREGIELYPTAANFYLRLVLALTEAGNTQDAIEVAREASLLFPENIILQLKKHLTLPIIYKSQEEINFYRHRFARGLEELIQQITPSDNAQSAIGGHTNFFLACQCLNDLELQQQYGQMVHRIMATNYPQLNSTQTQPLGQNSKIRIGYVSSFLWEHTVGKLTLGWLRHHDRSRFEIYCYYLGTIQDQFTQQFRLHSDAFHHIPDNIEAVAEQIIADRLHILVFLDIGMYPPVTLLAALRLAPVQCTTWAHPVTSGLPTIDYFLSSDLMEPENAQSHYSEQLIRLANIGISYPKPTITEKTKTRSDFHLRDDAVVYLSCQTLFKYLPQYDYIFAIIASRVPSAQFVFISRPNAYIAEQFSQRLQLAFSKYSLDSEDYCVILPGQNQIDYWNINLMSDIFLDTFGWSGGNTTLEAIACNLPVVTCPGELMRGRHSYAILTMLGATQTIAKDEAEYIEIAVKLGIDPEWRQSISQQIMRDRSHLYEDKTCVATLEEFYLSVGKKADC